MLILHSDIVKTRHIKENVEATMNGLKESALQNNVVLPEQLLHEIEMMIHNAQKVETVANEDKIDWICCETCNKWRVIPLEGPQINKEKVFFCDMIESLTCETPEQMMQDQAPKENTPQVVEYATDKIYEDYQDSFDLEQIFRTIADNKGEVFDPTVLEDNDMVRNLAETLLLVNQNLQRKMVINEDDLCEEEKKELSRSRMYMNRNQREQKRSRQEYEAQNSAEMYFRSNASSTQTKTCMIRFRVPAPLSSTETRDSKMTYEEFTKDFIENAQKQYDQRQIQAVKSEDDETVVRNPGLDIMCATQMLKMNKGISEVMFHAYVDTIKENFNKDRKAFLVSVGVSNKHRKLVLSLTKESSQMFRRAYKKQEELVDLHLQNADRYVSSKKESSEIVNQLKIKKEIRKELKEARKMKKESKKDIFSSETLDLEDADLNDSVQHLLAKLKKEQKIKLEDLEAGPSEQQQMLHEAPQASTPSAGITVKVEDIPRKKMKLAENGAAFTPKK
jgi:hypothetical protein